MPERQSRHPDNELIDELGEEAIGGQHERSGGNVNRRVGTRAELNRAQGTLDGDKVERAVGSDNPEQDARKGEKTFEKITTGRQDG